MKGFLDKTMFEIYREAEFNKRYRVVYFTELNEHQRDEEIPTAMMGQHIYDGFLSGWKKDEAKAKIDEILERMNQGQAVPPIEIQSILKPYLEE